MVPHKNNDKARMRCGRNEDEDGYEEEQVKYTYTDPKRAVMVGHLTAATIKHPVIVMLGCAC